MNVEDPPPAEGMFPQQIIPPAAVQNAADPAELQLQQLQQQVLQLQLELGEARAQNEARAMAPQVPIPKLPQPQVWDGVGDSLTNYALPVRAYLDYHNLSNSPEHFPHAYSFLPPLYQLYFQSVREGKAAAHPNMPQNFDAFLKILSEIHAEPNQQQNAMQQLEGLRQKPGQLGEYIRDFTRLMLYLHEELSPFAACYMFNRGLTPKLQESIAGKFQLSRQCSLQQLVQAATAAESVQLTLGRRTAPPAGHSSYRAPATTAAAPTGSFSNSSYSGPVPMELNAASRHSMRGMYFKGRCWRCHQRGHIEADCPNASFQPQPRRQAVMQSAAPAAQQQSRQYSQQGGRQYSQQGGRPHGQQSQQQHQGKRPGQWQRKN